MLDMFALLGLMLVLGMLAFYVNKNIRALQHDQEALRARSEQCLNRGEVEVLMDRRLQRHVDEHGHESRSRPRPRPVRTARHEHGIRAAERAAAADAARVPVTPSVEPDDDHEEDDGNQTALAEEADADVDDAAASDQHMPDISTEAAESEPEENLQPAGAAAVRRYRLRRRNNSTADTSTNPE